MLDVRNHHWLLIFLYMMASMLGDLPMYEWAIHTRRNYLDGSGVTSEDGSCPIGNM